MSISIRIMLPIFSTNVKVIYFKGYVVGSESNELTIYITKFSDNEQAIQKSNYQKDLIYGYWDNNSKSSFFKQCPGKSDHFLVLHGSISKPRINKLVINRRNIDAEDRCIIIFYDYDRISESEVEWEYCDKISTLQNLVRSECTFASGKITDESPIKCPYWLTSSMFIQHVINYINIFRWLINTFRRDKNISIKQGNLILAIIIDLLLGYLVLQCLTQDKSELSSLLMGVLEKLINMLYSLLKWLMGAPAGLKLNNAFNKMLGNYFSYHVQLWWLFLDVSGEKLETILHIYYYLGYLGFTFQAAVISDMICIATFHSYCIYVYAARMFNIQISGLIALLRFFVGRKYNPLRGGIDSCEYTNQELFVGTVAFTILLLLLPTTLMYYIVFTMFRVLSLLVQYTLAKLINLVHTIPLYVSLLWLIHSPKIAGNVLIEVINQDASPLTIRLRLLNKSIFYLVKNFRPPVQDPKPIMWTNFLSNVFVGKQII